jgi:hypothetical protein
MATYGATRARASWEDLIDPTVPARHSILRRYAPSMSWLRLGLRLSKEALALASVQEGAELYTLAMYRGVKIVVCDESSFMLTGTYKDLDACLIAAIAQEAGLTEVVLSSGGNLGYALAVYAARTDLDVFFFHPKTTGYKLDASALSKVIQITVDRPEKEVKALAAAFAAMYGIMLVPDIRWRLAASACRAMFILEQSKALDIRVDSIAQVMCAGYGPAGIYGCFSELIREKLLAPRNVPRFVGFQQAANSPMVQAWQAGSREIKAEHINAKPDEYLEPGLYNTDPGTNYTRLADMLKWFGGRINSVDASDYEKHAPRIVDWFAQQGYEFTKIPGTNEILEKTGLLTGVGICSAIDQGHIAEGETVLYLLTGGMRKLSPTTFSRAEPRCLVDGSKGLEQWLVHLGEVTGIQPKDRRASQLLPAFTT